MRATNNKHYGSETRRYAQPAKKAEKTVKSHKGVKIASAVCASLIACAALVIPTTTLAPNVDAYEDSRAASFSIGGLDQFSAVITNNCEEVTTAPNTEAVTAAQETTKAIKEASASKDEKKSESSASDKKEETKSEEKSSSSSSSSESSSKSSGSVKSAKAESYASGYSDDSYAEVASYDDDDDNDSVYAADNSYSDYSGSFLIDIANPDYSYSPSRVSLSSYDRAKLERLVMGEAGSMGYLGCALVAQSIRDAMNRSNTSSIDQIISQYQYFGSTSIEPNSDVKSAVSYIFDNNGAAVQHRVICFYIGYSSWHETQTFITQVGGVRFFDLNA